MVKPFNNNHHKEMDELRNALLRPGKAALARLRFASKLAMVVLLMVIPMTYLVYTYVTYLNGNIAFTAKERLGLPVVQATTDLIMEVQKHRGTAARVLSGDRQARQTLLDLQGKADAAVARLDGLDRRYGAALKTTREWSELRSTWGSLKSKVEGMTGRESFQAHTEYITALLMFISAVADNSNLTLDPQLVTSHLIAMVSNSLPRMTEYLGQARAVGSGVATRKTLSEQEKIQLYVLTGNMKAAAEQTKLGLEQIYEAAPNLKKRLAELATAADSAATGLGREVTEQILEAKRISLSGEVFFNRATAAIDTVYGLLDESEAALGDLLRARESALRRDRMTAIPLLAGGLLLASYFLLAFVVSSRESLDTLEVTARRVADGDLTVTELTSGSRDEIGQVMAAFNQTVQNLRQLIRGVTTSSESVLAASEELSAASEQSARGTREAAQAVGQVADGATEQAKTAEITRRTMTELHQAIQQIAQGIQHAATEMQQSVKMLGQMAAAVEGMAAGAENVAESAHQAATTARGGAEAVNRTVTGMERIRQAVGDSSERMRNLEQLSAQIGEITQVISGIAEQTSLLALNASIEAARAGEHGRGFAVVAQEVQTLAERAANSNREISKLIGDIQNRTAEAMKAMEVANSEVQEGSQLAGEAKETLQHLLGTVQQAAENVQSIATTARELRTNTEGAVRAFDSVAAVTEESTAATEEMAAGATEVTSAMERVARVAQESASTAEELSAALTELDGRAKDVSSSAQELAAIAQGLQEQVVRFKV